MTTVKMAIRGTKIFACFVGVLYIFHHPFVIHVYGFSSLNFIKTTMKSSAQVTSSHRLSDTQVRGRLVSSTLLFFNNIIQNRNKQNQVSFDPKLISLSSLSSHNINGHVDQYQSENQKEHDSFSTFEACLMQQQTYSPQSSSTQQVSTIIRALQSIGFTSSEELLDFIADFEGRPEILSKVLQNDFDVPPLLSHQLRAALFKYLRYHNDNQPNENRDKFNNHNEQPTRNKGKNEVALDKNYEKPLGNTGSDTDLSVGNFENSIISEKDTTPEKLLFKSVVVNTKAKRRKEKDKQNDGTTGGYGLPNDFSHIHPKLSDEISKDFKKFMIQPMATYQDAPIREATATVYLRHARLFLGWYLQQQECHIEAKGRKNVSINQIIPNSNSTSVQPIIDFILWLREEREISHSCK